MVQKNYFGGFLITLMYLIFYFLFKYFGDQFFDFWDLDRLTDKVILGDITVTQFFIVSILIGVLLGIIYNIINIKAPLDAIFKNTILVDRD